MAETTPQPESTEPLQPFEETEEQKEKFNYLMENKEIIDLELSKGAKKARSIAQEVLQRVRQNIGY